MTWKGDHPRVLRTDLRGQMTKKVSRGCGERKRRTMYKRREQLARRGGPSH